MITINIDLGSAQEVKALVIYDHNLSATATITLKGVDPTIFSEAVVRNEDKIIHYLSVATTKRYWQLQITDALNPDEYIEIGEMFLGDYLELSRGYENGFSEENTFLRTSNMTAYGVEKDRFYNQQRSFQFDFGMLPSADVTSLEELVTAITNKSTGILKSFWFNPDDDYPNNSWMVKLYSFPITHVIRTYYDVPLQLVEVVTSV